MSENNFDKLIRVLRERDIQHDPNALKKAYNDPENRPGIDEWIQEYLTPDTLLTKDEATLYAALVKSGEAELLAAQDLSQVQALDDQELRTAIDEIRRSTANIERHTESLKLQKTALEALIKTERKTRDARVEAEEEQVRKWEAERSQIAREVEELSQSLAYQTADLEQQSKDSEVALRQLVDGVLKEDDKLLLSLQKLAGDLGPAKTGNDEALARIQDLCARLIKHTVEGVRTKLDRVYIEALGHEDALNGSAGESQEAVDLQEELESLYAEILPVAQMSAEQQFLEPARKAVAGTDGITQERSAKAFEYINECLLFLTHKAETVLRRAEETQAHNMALKFVLQVATEELSKPTFSSTNSNTDITRSKGHRRKSSLAQSPLRPRGLRRRSSGSTEGLEPEQQLARNMGITLPSSADTESLQGNVVEQVLAERVKKLEIHSSSLRASTENSISSQLHDAHVMLQLLQDTLLKETPYKTVELLSPEMVGSVNTFEQDVAYVQTNIDEIDLHVLQARNATRDQIVERWAR